MDAIQHLRQYVGHAPLLMAGAAALILDEQDRLVAERIRKRLLGSA